MFSKPSKSGSTSKARSVFAALGLVSVGTLGYMGYNAFESNEQTPLDLNSLPEENAAAWER